jgi:hypothetical protein
MTFQKNLQESKIENFIINEVIAFWKSNFFIILCKIMNPQILFLLFIFLWYSLFIAISLPAWNIMAFTLFCTLSPPPWPYPWSPHSQPSSPCNLLLPSCLPDIWVTACYSTYDAIFAIILNTYSLLNPLHIVPNCHNHSVQ